MAARKGPTKTAARPKNTGIPYEQLTREVFARMEDLQKIGAIVTHDVTLTGKSGATHQVDVYVEFTVGDLQYKTIVSCKDYASAAKKIHVLELAAVADDVPGQPRGILVSRQGFQKGAIEYAKHHGIDLYRLSDKQEEDWEGLIKEVHTTLTVEIPNFDLQALQFDEEWVKDQAIQSSTSSSSWSTSTIW